MTETAESTESRGRVLLIDDEPQVLEVYRRVLQRGGFDVEVLRGGTDIASCIEAQTFDVVISDITMPAASGLDVLRIVQAHDRDLPVVLMTGRGRLASALGALEHGAHRYLLKPVEPAHLCRVAEDGVAQRRAARMRSTALEAYHEAARVQSRRSDLALALDRALATLQMVYQPIVSWSELRVIAYEALVRTGEQSLARPDQLLAAAEVLGRLPELGQEVRRQVAAALGNLSGDLMMFVNLHPADLQDPELFAPESPLSALAARVVLEVTERESLSGFGDVAGPASALRSLGFRLAVDDFGSGYGGLGALVQLRPDVVKIDVDLVRGIDADTTKRKLVESVAALCAELGIGIVAEGVETAIERDTLVELGIDLMQGHLFGRPGPLIASPNIEADPATARGGLPAVHGGQASPRSRTARRVAYATSRSSNTRRSRRVSELGRIREQLDCAPVIVVRIDRNARITHVNEAWRALARSNDADAATVEGVGLEYCSAAARAGIGGDTEIADEIADVLCGICDAFSSAFPCHTPSEARWFRVDAKRVAEHDAVVLIHTNITDQHIAEARLRVQSVVAQSLAAAAPLHVTCRRLARATCEGLGWEHAAIWLPDAQGNLTCSEVWTQAGFDAEAFKAAKEVRDRELAMSLPHRVWASGTHEWITDLRSNAYFASSEYGPGSGLLTGFAVPLRSEGEVFAVLEFFGRIRRSPDDALLELIEMSGNRIGAQALQARAKERLDRAEAAQREMRSTLDAIMHCVPAHIMAVDRQGLVRFVNRCAQDMTIERVVGTDWLRYLPTDEHAEQTDRLRRVIEEGVSVSYESTSLDPAGSARYFSSQLGPMHQGAKIVGAVLVTYDVTDLKRAEAELIATQRMAAIGTLAAGVAHEINTPIQFINDSVHFLRDASNDVLGLIDGLKQVAELASDGATAAWIDEAVTAAHEREEAADLPYLREHVPRAIERCIEGLERVSTIVHSLKEYAHPASTVMASVDLNRAIHNTLTIARSEYKYVAELVTELSELPYVTCFINDINQVVLNLVVNAAHAIGDVVQGSESHGTITVRTWQEGEQVVISVGDTGSGIADDIAHRIFEPFFTTKEVGRGSGQGLALAWAVVRNKHAGELTFETKVGEGTTFFIRLPIAGKQASMLTVEEST